MRVRSLSLSVPMVLAGFAITTDRAGGAITAWQDSRSRMMRKIVTFR